MNRRMVGAVLVLVVTGCASSVADRDLLRTISPAAVYTTDKSVADTTRCVHQSLQAAAYSAHTVTRMQQGDSQVIVVSTVAQPNVVVTVSPAGDGAHVDYRARYRAGYGDITNAVMGCQ